MKNQTMWIILGALGIGGLILLLRKPAPVVAGMPAVAQAGVTIAPTVAPTTIQGKLINLATQQTGLPESELTVRSLLPLDVGLTTWSFNLTAVGGWNTVAAGNVASDRFIAITGVSYAGTVAEQIRVTAASSTVAYFSIQHVPGITETHHIDISPIIVQQNQPVIIEVYSSAAAGTDEVILEGMTVEPRGRLLA